ncbi:serine-type endopeptidase activity protein [Homalodisca vitripennis]|nr:serine-type endopeptidase activity protein [Homalodisca vitripennis]
MFPGSSECALYYRGYFTCGAAILSEEWILTAAHCVYDRDESEFSVLTGTNDLLDPNGTETYVSQVIIHENYKSTVNQVDDIALLKLTVALEFDNLTQPVTLSHPNGDPPTNSAVVVMGWGANKASATFGDLSLRGRYKDGETQGSRTSDRGLKSRDLIAQEVPENSNEEFRDCEDKGYERKPKAELIGCRTELLKKRLIT